MSSLHPRVLDNGLSVLDAEATAIHACTAEPANFAAVAGGEPAAVAPAQPEEAPAAPRRRSRS